jgi:DNA polymerase III subunit gamma/tau
MGLSSEAAGITFPVRIWKLGIRFQRSDHVPDGTHPEGGEQRENPATAARAGEYTVVARRYRPQTFDELIGQEHVARALVGAIAANRVGHAYLFTGARGVGKTSAARILAKALDCEQGPTATPCNQCDICLSIGAGSDVDVIEIDGASNRGIDEIRQLRQNVSIRPSRARFKIYIIDEVHMLTREAFNALLKTLEEPPEHVKFIFCTTEANKIPITILSRCQRFDFAGIHLPSIVERLRQIVEAEGVAAEPEALAILARRANGSMRDSQSLLEQLLTFGERKITTADVHAMLGTAGEARLADLVRYLVDRDAAAALRELDAALDQGADVGQLLEQLLGTFRDAMTAAVGCAATTFLHTSAADQPRLAEVSKQLGLETVLAIMQILDHTLSRLRYSTQGRTLAEMALVRIANLDNLDELSDLIAQLRGGGATSPAAPPRPAASTGSTATKKKAESNLPDGAANSARADAVQTAMHSPTSEAPTSDARSTTGAAATALELTAETVGSIWKEAIANLTGLLVDNISLCESVTVRAPGRLAVAFREKYTACKAFCERTDQVAMLEAALAEVAGGPVKVDFSLLADEPSATVPGRQGATLRQRMAEKAEHPLVRKAAELFDARLTQIEEPKS